LDGVVKRARDEDLLCVDSSCEIDEKKNKQGETGHQACPVQVILTTEYTD